MNTKLNSMSVVELGAALERIIDCGRGAKTMLENGAADRLGIRTECETMAADILELDAMYKRCNALCELLSKKVSK